MEMTKMIGALISSLQRSNGTNGSNGNNSNNSNYRYAGNGSDETINRGNKYNEVDNSGFKQEVEGNSINTES